MRRVASFTLGVVAALGFCTEASAAPKQPKVFPGPMEPDWVDILRNRFGLSMFSDLVNPVKTTVEATPGLFEKAGPGPVKYTPIIGLGLESITRGGWYTPGKELATPDKHNLWSYQVKNTTADLETGKNLPPRLLPVPRRSLTRRGSVRALGFKRRSRPTAAFSPSPKSSPRSTPGLAKQPYKAMIYPNRDKATGKLIPHSYVIGWEYSTNDDFQDIVCQVDNVELVVTTPAK